MPQIRWNFGLPARINDMATRAHSSAAIQNPGLPLVRMREGVLRLVRAPGMRGPWAPEEIAHALSSRRVDFLGALSRRSEAASLSTGTREDIIDDAIELVVMSRDPIRNEQHLEGSFWATVRLLLLEHRGGRHSVRVGSRHREDFDVAKRLLSEGSEPSEIAETKDRIARAADFMAQLDTFEQQVVTLMATQGLDD